MSTAATLTHAGVSIASTDEVIAPPLTPRPHEVEIDWPDHDRRARSSDDEGARERQRLIDHQRESLWVGDLTHRTPEPLPASTREHRRSFSTVLGERP